MKAISIEKFGAKMMVASRSINKIPTEYLKIAQNSRIFDGGIGPRRGKILLTESTIGTNNKGGFMMQGKLYQITNSKIFEIDLITGTQTEKAILTYDAITDVLVYGDFAIITSDGEDLEVFNGVGLEITPTTVPASNSGIIEYTRGYSFLASGNILYISRPITAANPEYAYDFTGTGSQNITFDSKITSLEGTMNGINIITEKKVEYLGANSLQNVAGAAAFITTPLGRSGEPVNNHCVVSSGDKVFFITKSLQLQTINYIQGTDSPSIGNLSSRPIVGIKEFLDNIDTDQPTAFGFYNKKDETIQFHLRRRNSPFNDVCLVYDLMNDTFAVDTGKNYNYVVENGEDYYGFSDVNSNIYNDDIGLSDAGIPIRFLIRTQDMNQGTITEKQYGGFFTAGGIGFLTSLDYTVKVDQRSVFSDKISGNPSGIAGLGEIGGSTIGGDSIGGSVEYVSILTPFERMADQGRIYRNGKRIQLEISSNSDLQDFNIDILGIMAQITNHLDIQNKF